ncbi:MAG: SUMF1/EgtB/PvdO family nonheme iron enzyme [Verrucomicrobiaceae bacterium]|nr:SUMF1/EgtB/PvdO family nonheme iron enzyme [Verrucomicrobiaceae bacterium]
MKLSLILCSVCSVGAVLVVLSSCTAPSAGGSGNKAPLAAVTKEQPFVNSLGMKFVPVPGTNILMCTTETTVAQYQGAGLGYQAQTFIQGSNHPAVGMNWYDAKAWCAWVSKKEGRKYRLPTDAEWSAAVGSGTYPWGNQWPPPNNCGNLAGQEMRGHTPAERSQINNGLLDPLGIKYPGGASALLIGGFIDRHKFTSPVGSYPANQLGLHDLTGNVREWCEDKLPSVLSWDARGVSRWLLYSSIRHTLLTSYGLGPGTRYGARDSGFRCVVMK